MFGSDRTDDQPVSSVGTADEGRHTQAFDPPTMGMGLLVLISVLLLPTASATSPLLVLPLLVPWAMVAFALNRGRAGLSAPEQRVVALVTLMGIEAPSVLMALLAYMRAPLHDSTTALLVPALALALLLAGAALAVVPGLRGSLAPLVLLGGLAYGYGGAVAANMIFDGSEARVVRATVVDKWVSNPVSRTRRGTSTTSGPFFNVEVETYGATRVDTDAYSYSKIGQPGCVHVRDGALGIEWFTIERCPPAPRGR